VETVENGIFHVRQAIFFRSSKIFCGEFLHPRWILCGKSQKRGEGDRFPEFFDVSAMPKPSLWIGSAAFSVEYPARIFSLIHRGPVDKIPSFRFSTELWRVCPHIQQGRVCRKRGIFGKNRGILEIYTNFSIPACAKLLFSTRFSTTCGKVGGKSTGDV
jgi:hypothetical protein